MRQVLLLALALFAGPAFAQDEEDDLFDDSKEKKGNNADVPDAGSFSDEDDLGIPTFNTPKPAEDKEKDLSAFVDPRTSVNSTTKMPIDVVGKDVLGDNWAPTIAIADKDAVVVEIPVLYARARAEFDGVAYWLVAETYADGKKVAEQRVQVTRDTIADKGPSIQFFRMFTPVSSTAGVIEVKVGKSTSAAGKPTLLFARSVTYKL
ncbi:MAG: hypothetical protein ACK4YP_13010 [Myxococcota bacterium]